MLIAGTRCSGQERAEEQVGAQSREVRIIPLLSCRGNGPTMFQCNHFVITYLMQPFWNKQYFNAASNTIKFPMFLLLSNLLDRHLHPIHRGQGWGEGWAPSGKKTMENWSYESPTLAYLRTVSPGAFVSLSLGFYLGSLISPSP